MTAWGGPSAIRNWDFDVIAQRTSEDARTLGSGLAAYLVKAALVDRGIQCYTSAPVRQLVTDGDGTVVGVVAERDGAQLRVRARAGVLLATSGYDSNPHLAAVYERVPAAEWHTAVFPGIDGDGLTMGAEVGAQVAVVPVDMTLPGFHVPGEVHEGNVPLYRFAMGELSYGIAVNRAGQRFADESFYRSFMQAVLEYDAWTQDYRNFPCYLIFDQAARDKFALGSIMPGEPVPEEFGARADSPDELAGMLGIDVAGFEATVARYNQDVAAGRDRAFGRGELPWARQMWGDLDMSPDGPAMRPINQPPYYGVRLTFVGVGQTNAGLATDADARVLHVRGYAIPGLYAAGNAAAYLELDRGYQSGMANARGMTFGYLAAKHAMDWPANRGAEGVAVHVAI
jgi:3-oxosteroid 1-dehydrogenase